MLLIKILGALQPPSNVQSDGKFEMLVQSASLVSIEIDLGTANQDVLKMKTCPCCEWACLKRLRRSEKRANLGCCVVSGSSKNPKLQVQATGACKALETSSGCRGSLERRLTRESRPPSYIKMFNILGSLQPSCCSQSPFRPVGIVQEGSYCKSVSVDYSHLLVDVSPDYGIPNGSRLWTPEAFSRRWEDQADGLQDRGGPVEPATVARLR